VRVSCSHEVAICALADRMAEGMMGVRARMRVILWLDVSLARS
jgi:hypothetical protein